MGLIIESGTGNGHQAAVDNEHRLHTHAVVQTEVAHESAAGYSYFWTDAYDYDAADTILWLANTSNTLNLLIEKIHVSSDTTTQFTIHLPAYAAPAGTVITGVNANRNSGRSADAECYRDETNNTQGDAVIQGICLANSEIVFPVDGKLVLGFHDCVAVDFVTAGTLAVAVFVGYYIAPEEV